MFNQVFRNMFQVVFLLVSDDMEYAKQNIYKRTRHSYNIFLAGSGNGEEAASIGKLSNGTS